MLRCAKCNDSKDVDELSHSRRNKSGRHSYCRACDAACYAQTRGGNANAAPSATPSAAPSATPRAVPSATPVMDEANTTEADQLYLFRYQWEN